MITNYEEIPLIPDHEVAQFIQILKNSKFNFVEQQYSPESFGNYQIELCSSTTCCRLTRDRGIWSIEIKGTLSNRWHYLYNLRTLITGEQYISDWPIDDQIQFLADHLSDIEKAFSPIVFIMTDVLLRREQIRVAKKFYNRNTGSTGAD